MHKIMLGSRQHGVLPKPPQCCKISKGNPHEVTLEKTPPSSLHLQSVIHLDPSCFSTACSGKMAIDFSQSGIRLLPFKA